MDMEGDFIAIKEELENIATGQPQFSFPQSEIICNDRAYSIWPNIVKGDSYK